MQSHGLPAVMVGCLQVNQLWTLLEFTEPIRFIALIMLPLRPRIAKYGSTYVNT